MPPDECWARLRFIASNHRPQAHRWRAVPRVDEVREGKGFASIQLHIFVFFRSLMSRSSQYATRAGVDSHFLTRNTCVGSERKTQKADFFVVTRLFARRQQLVLNDLRAIHRRIAAGGGRRRPLLLAGRSRPQQGGMCRMVVTYYTC